MMIETRFTPGPWRRGIGDDCHNVFDATGRIVAMRCGYADGTAIATLPDLYALLQRAADQLCHYATDYPQPEALSIINAADKLLAKARGEVPAPSREE